MAPKSWPQTGDEMHEAVSAGCCPIVAPVHSTPKWRMGNLPLNCSSFESADAGERQREERCCAATFIEQAALPYTPTVHSRRAYFTGSDVGQA